MLLITRRADHIQAILAWGYVVLRAAHDFIPIGSKSVQPRFFVYLASCAVLAAI